jgi:hypothetical protein
VTAVRLATSLTLLFITTLACVPCARAAQKSAALPKRERRQEAARLTPEAEAIVADARVAPPEFGSDALISVAQSSKVSDASLKRELLEEAFRLAAGAQQPVKRHSVVDNVDTRAGYLSYGFDLGLDALSLRCRVVRAMLRLDKRRAREMLAEIQPDPGLEVLGCDDPLVYDVGLIYETVGEVARGAFGVEELRRREHVRLVEQYVAGVRRVAQVGPAARMIVALRPSASDLLPLVQEFASALKSVPSDARSFAAAFYRDELQRAVHELLKECDAKGVGKDALLEANRIFLLAQVAGVQCEDNKDFVERLRSRGDLKFVNENLVKPPLSAEELVPRRVEGRAKSYEFWRTTEARRLLMDFKGLRFGGGERQLTAGEMARTEWRRGLSEYLARLSDWEGHSEEMTSDYINQKSVLFDGLLDLELVPEMRERVLADYVAFLREPDLRRESRIEWFQHVKRLAVWANSQDEETHTALLNAFANSDVVTLRLYAKLEAFDPVKVIR